MLIKLTLAHSKEPALFNIDTVCAISASDSGGTVLDFGQDVFYTVEESFDAVQSMLSARIMNP